VNRSAEIISTLLIDPCCRDAIFDTLTEQDFQGECAVWYSKLRRLYKQNPDNLDSTDLQAQCYHALKDEMLQRSAEGWEQAMQGLVGETIRRRVGGAAARALAMVDDHTVTPEVLVELITDIAESAQDTRVTGAKELPMEDKLQAAYQRSLQRAKGLEGLTIPWSLGCLDHYITIECSDEGSFGIVGARPAVGKTSFAGTVIANMIMRGIKVGLIGVETTEVPYVYRIQALTQA